MKLLSVAFATVLIAAGVAGCSSSASDDSARSSTFDTSAPTYSPSGSESVCAEQCLETYSPPAAPSTTTTPASSPSGTAASTLSKKQRNKYIRLLYGQYTKEFVTRDPDEWIDLAQTSCSAYRRGTTDGELKDVLEQELSPDAATWFLAATKTLVCPDVK